MQNAKRNGNVVFKVVLTGGEQLPFAILVFFSLGDERRKS